ncbi:MAG: agmatinase [Thermodesulfobacteriota bacterium]
MKLPFIEQTYLSGQTPFEKSKIALLGCPYDGSASFRPGARFGPSAIRKASWGIETYSPYFKKDISRQLIHDLGDLELPLGEKELAFDLIRKAIHMILSAKKFPISLGGDHLITLPIIEEVIHFYPDLSLIQLDAHTDLREDYLGERLSHSTVMKRIKNLLKKGKLFQIGVRSGTEKEFRDAEKMDSLVSLEESSFQSMLHYLKQKPVYITLDLDVFDPSLIPGVGTPEPGGLTFQVFISILKKLRSLHVIGFDLVELTPDYDPSQISSVNASVILREMILAFGT